VIGQAAMIEPADRALSKEEKENRAMKLYQVVFPAAVALLPAPGPVTTAPGAAIPLPELNFQQAVQVAQSQYNLAMQYCGFVYWSSRDACERSAADGFTESVDSARSVYQREQTAFKPPAANGKPSSSAGR
jgi:hypothetical protein